MFYFSFSFHSIPKWNTKILSSLSSSLIVVGGAWSKFCFCQKHCSLEGGQQQKNLLYEILTYRCHFVELEGWDERGEESGISHHHYCCRWLLPCVNFVIFPLCQMRPRGAIATDIRMSGAEWVPYDLHHHALGIANELCYPFSFRAKVSFEFYNHFYFCGFLDATGCLSLCFLVWFLRMNRSSL